MTGAATLISRYVVATHARRSFAVTGHREIKNRYDTPAFHDQKCPAIEAQGRSALPFAAVTLSVTLEPLQRNAFCIHYGSPSAGTSDDTEVTWTNPTEQIASEPARALSKAVSLQKATIYVI